MARRVGLVPALLLTAACATTERPHPPMGAVWGYIAAPPNLPGVEVVGYAPDRPSCEFSRAMAQTRSGIPVPSQRSVQCQQLQVLPYREGADSVYWVFSMDPELEQFAAGGNDRGFCASLRQEAVKAVRRDDSLGECEPVIVVRQPPR
jgi:hypothetical protein